jgi:mono/diheme cytochrome c family protein
LFTANCALCHGTNADGREGKGPPLIHKIYEPGHHGDASFQSAALNGVRAHHWRFGNMPPVPGIKPKEVDLIIAYVREVQSHNGIQ